jgi:Na+/H+-translocating membrane pyrophosphatase
MVMLCVAGLLQVRAAPSGEGQQVAIALQISQGATSFLITEYKYLTVFVGAMAIFVAAVLEGAVCPLAITITCLSSIPPCRPSRTADVDLSLVTCHKILKRS